MTSMDAELLAAVRRVGDELAGIRTVLEAAVGLTDPAPVAEPRSVACAHPDEARVSMAAARDDDFYCRECSTHVAQPAQVEA